MRDGLGNRIAGVALGLVALAVVMVDQAPTAWAETPPSSERFTLVMGGEAVKDNTTGLIWEQSADLIHDVWSASLARSLSYEDGRRPEGVACPFGERAEEPRRSLAEGPSPPPRPSLFQHQVGDLLVDHAVHQR